MATGYVMVDKPRPLLCIPSHYSIAQQFGATEFFNPKDHDRPTQQVFCCNCISIVLIITGAS